jgi:hypothetical protein
MKKNGWDAFDNKLEGRPCADAVSAKPLINRDVVCHIRFCISGTTNRELRIIFC